MVCTRKEADMAEEITSPAASGADDRAADQSTSAGGGTPTAPTPSEPSALSDDTQAPSADRQAVITQLQQENARLKGQLEALEPYVQFGAPAPSARAGGPVPEEELTPEEKAERDAERLRAAVQEVAQQSNQRYGKLEERLFFAENPDLKEHRDLVLVHFQRTSPRQSIEDRLAEAAKNTRAYLKGIEAKVEARITAEAKKTRAAAAATDGVMGGGVTPAAAKDEDAGWKKDAEGGYPDYSAARREQQGAMYGGK
jgi:hypothetical protein